MLDIPINVPGHEKATRQSTKLYSDNRADGNFIFGDFVLLRRIFEEVLDRPNFI